VPSLKKTQNREEIGRRNRGEKGKKKDWKEETPTKGDDELKDSHKKDLLFHIRRRMERGKEKERRGECSVALEEKKL